MAVKVGDIKRLDYQSDIWCLQYEVIEHVEGNTFKVRYLEDDEVVKAEILADPSPYCGGQKELDWRRDNMYGRETEMRFVSHEEWARAF